MHPSHLQHVKLINVQAEAFACVINHGASVTCSHAIRIHKTSPFVRERRKDWHLVMLYGHAILRVCLEIY